LEETSARDIMVPRVDIVAVAEDASSQDIVDVITEKGHSRLPVFRESIDEIVGILYAKDLLPFVIGSTRTLPIMQLLRPVYVVPESKRLDDLLGELRRNRVHIAVVADEYGGTAGLVTIEDILEEIVGEIHDEYDEEMTLLEQVSDSEIIVDGRLPIEEIEEALGIPLTGDDPMAPPPDSSTGTSTACPRRETASTRTGSEPRFLTSRAIGCDGCA
jgi:putative hemolysin